MRAEMMKTFSERQGIKPVKTGLQVGRMDDALRNSLWSAVDLFYWTPMQVQWIEAHEELALLCKNLWFHHFKEPIDTIGDHWPTTRSRIRTHFFACEWNEVYDFIEFIANNDDRHPDGVNTEFMKFCNNTLKRELSGYRFVGRRIVQITSEAEIAEIEEALQAPDAFDPVKNHLKGALDRLADRKSPDYRNSIKESILAVEALCQLITSDAKATLAKALKKIDDKMPLHGALKGAFINLYGYSSDAEGIRHALLEQATLDFEDAKFMLVACSAFTNYLIEKSEKAGIEL